MEIHPSHPYITNTIGTAKRKCYFKIEDKRLGGAASLRWKCNLNLIPPLKMVKIERIYLYVNYWNRT